MSANAYPLQWPQGRKRWTGPREPGKFKVTEAQATNEMFDELDLLGASDVVVSSNRQPFSRSRANPEDPGVAVYFIRKGREVCIACDKWHHIEHNLRAVGLNIAAIRGIERWGTEDMVDAAFTGYMALPSSIEMGPGQARAWWEVLQVSQTADWAVIEKAYKTLLHTAHPDKGGSAYAFQELQTAYKQAKESRK